MPTISERLSNLFPGPRERKRLRGATELMLNAYQRRNLLGGQVLEEYDTRNIDNMIRHMNDQVLSGDNDTGEPDEQERIQAVDESRYLYHKDVAVRHGVRMWTNYGMGTDPQVIITDKVRTSSPVSLVL